MSRKAKLSTHKTQRAHKPVVAHVPGKRPRTGIETSPGTPAQKLAALKALAKAQGIEPIVDPSDLIGDFWPEHESVDDFVEARQRWQREEAERHG